MAREERDINKEMKDEMTSPVFVDPTGRRAHWLYAVATVIATLGGLFLATIVTLLI